MPKPSSRKVARTQIRALAVLQRNVKSTKASVEDERAKELLNDRLARKVLDIAWRHQFDDERRDCLIALRDAVDFAIEEKNIGVHDADS